MALISNKGSQFQVFRTKNTVYFLFFFFKLSASRLGKLTLFSYHKPLETPQFNNVFLNTQVKKEISQLLSFRIRG